MFVVPSICANEVAPEPIRGGTGGGERCWERLPWRFAPEAGLAALGRSGGVLTEQDAVLSKCAAHKSLEKMACWPKRWGE